MADVAHELKEYSDVHRSLIQAFLVRGIMKSSDSLRLFEKILGEYDVNYNPQQLQKLFLRVCQKINKTIRTLAMEIRNCVDERTGRIHFALVNTMASDKTVQAFRDYKPDQLEYLKLIMKTIFQQDDRALPYNRCLNLSAALTKKLSLEDSEKLIERLLADKWLEKVGEGMIGLHVRTVAEMEPYLKSEYKLEKCEICGTVVTILANQKCGECDCHAHWFCIAKLPRRKCPKADCRAEWPERDQSQGSSGGASRTEGVSAEDLIGGSSTDDASTQPRAHKRIQMIEDSSDSDDMDTGEPGTSGQKKPRQEEEEEEEEEEEAAGGEDDE